MKKHLLPILIGAVSVLLAVAVLAFFNPFNAAFDKIFSEQEELPLGDVGYSCSWLDTKGQDTVFAEVPMKMTERYFECFYTALGDKNADCAGELSMLYGSGHESLVYDLAALSSCSTRLDGSFIDLSVKSAKVYLRLKNIIPIGKEGCIITLMQSAELVFDSLKGVSSGDGIYTHTFIFEKHSGDWYITSHECGLGVWSYARRVMNALCGGTTPSYNMLAEKLTLFQKALPSKVKATADLITAKSGGTMPSAESGYNREVSVQYALSWSNSLKRTRNEEQWHDYENDNANFVSQCIYKGFGKMDVSGANVWKWFDIKPDNKGREEGCSSSWTSAEDFWSYCTNNDYKGICALCSAAGGQMEKGDVIQLMINEKAVSQVIVTDIVTDTRKNTVELLVTGHDSEYVNYPLSLIPCDSVRFIKIIGWNDEN